MEQTKFDYLKKVKDTYPSTVVLFYDKLNSKRWNESKEIKDCNEEEIDDINLLRVLPNEVILDIENKDNLNEIEKKLVEKDWGYVIWETGSRGYHIYIEFDKLDKLDIEIRQIIRKYIIDYFKTDISLSKDGQFVACPYANHFKTGKLKSIVKNNYKLNTLDESIIKIAKEEYEEINKIFQNVFTDENFKDYLNDPFLNYVLSKQINEGDRNNIIFKNIAIGLVKNGLNREDIIKIVTKIVSNCPGKTIGEFMGWVDKAYNGELREYNKSEINKWSYRYNHPIFYVIQSGQELDDLYLNDIRFLWKVNWDRKIACQDIWRQLCLYNLMGTIIKENIEDYRLHIVFSSPSGSGKDEGVNIIYEILTNLVFDAHKPSSITDRTLIGAPNVTAIEYNIKNKDKIESGKTTKTNEIELGLLHYADWIAFAESETVFKPSLYNKQLHVILRQAMDKTRNIEKGVGGKIINIKTNTSFIFTTYTMSETIYKLLDNGLFQRCIYYNKKLSDEEHEIIVSKMFEKVTTKKNQINEIYMNKLMDKLKVLKEWYDLNKDNIEYHKGSNIYMMKLWDKYKKNYETLEKIDKNNLDSMLRRGVNTIDKLLRLNCICAMKTNITKEDVDEIFILYKECMDSVKEMILSQNTEHKKDKSIMRILLRGGFPTMRVHEEMKEQLGIKGDKTRRKYLIKLINTGYISEYIEGSKKMLMLSDKGRELVEYD